MKLNKIASVVAVACVFAAPAAYANLVVNGDFEAPVVTAAGGYEYRSTGDAGWMWTSAPNRTVQFNTGYNQTVGAGAQSVQLEHQGDWISQIITTTPGALYDLSFLLSGYVPPGPGYVVVDVTGSAPMNFGPAGAAWAMQSGQFTATSASTTIKFTNNVGYPGAPNYTHLDNIVVNAVPEPGTLALLGFGLIGLGLSRRKLQA